MEFKPKVFVATPCYGKQIFMDYLTSWTRTIPLFMERKWGLQLCTLGNESLIPRARNILVSKFLATDFTHLMFIDADISWDAEDIIKMVDADKPIIGGVYPKKAYKWDLLKTPTMCQVLNHMNEEEREPRFYDENLSPFLMDYVIRFKEMEMKDVLEVNFVGTGFMMIKREVLELMVEKYSDTKFNYDKNHATANQKENDNLYALFDCEVRDKEYLSEDYLFCKRWQDMGGKIYAYTPAELKHTGSHTFNGSFSRKIQVLQ